MGDLLERYGTYPMVFCLVNWFTVCHYQQQEDKYRNISFLHYKRAVLYIHHEALLNAMAAPFATRLGQVILVSFIVLGYSPSNHCCVATHSCWLLGCLAAW